METSTTFSANASLACHRLLAESGALDWKGYNYAQPFCNYVASWSISLPIKTIVIGQNPYPKPIYPCIGSAFSYDSSKSSGVPKTVQVLAAHIYNYDKTPMDDSISCFRDSWACAQSGTIFINETIFSAFDSEPSNTKPIKEMEAQLRAIQVLITESIIMGRTSFTCLAMGIRAAQMSSVLRSWFPKDSGSIRVLTCKNPAARDIGDMESHNITIGSKAVSKLLSSIVSEYVAMGGRYKSVAETRAAQNIKTFKDSAANLESSQAFFSNELESLAQRIRDQRLKGEPKCTLEDLENNMGKLSVAITHFKNATVVHNTAILMMIENIKADNAKSDNKQPSSPKLPVLAPIAQTPVVRRPRRVVSMSVVPEASVPSLQIESPSPVQAVSVTDEPVTRSTPAADNSIVSSGVHVPPPRSEVGDDKSVVSRRRRRIVYITPTQPSEAGTEYTTVTTMGTDKTRIGGTDMNNVECQNIRCFAEWYSKHMSENPALKETLITASDERVASSEFAKNVLRYIRERREENPTCDFYDELLVEDSLSSIAAPGFAD
ncbi:TPA_asm: hypothetical protein GF876_14720 [Listeria monocytogenes]|nr:hypothetical protein [Listeria monocytogenes]HAA5926468.1 hypothetical protein [Listeria monocytogenes]HAA5971278.1 hypothetical protein [Listeria monocytogenes]